MVEMGIPQEAVYVMRGLVGAATLAMAFRKEVRFEVRRRQGNICDCCGEAYTPLQTHHRKPECEGGSSERIENAVGLCNSCHKVIDDETFKRGIRYPQVHTRERYYPQGNGLR